MCWNQVSNEAMTLSNQPPVHGPRVRKEVQVTARCHYIIVHREHSLYAGQIAQNSQESDNIRANAYVGFNR